MEAGLKTSPAAETDTTKTDRAHSSSDTNNLIFSPEQAEAATDKCVNYTFAYLTEHDSLAEERRRAQAESIDFGPIYAYLAEQGKNIQPDSTSFEGIYKDFARREIKTHPAIIEEGFETLKESIDKPFYEITPDDYDNIRLTSSLLLSGYWELDNETAKQPPMRDAACAAYLSNARVCLAEAEQALTSQDAELLEEEALSYLIAALATQARPNQDEIDDLEKSPEDDPQAKQTNHVSDDDSPTEGPHTANKLSKEASELIDLIVDRREYREETKEVLLDEERIMESERIRDEIGRISCLLQGQAPISGLIEPSLESAQALVSTPSRVEIGKGALIGYINTLKAVEENLFKQITGNKPGGELTHLVFRNHKSGPRSIGNSSDKNGLPNFPFK